MCNRCLESVTPIASQSQCGRCGLPFENAWPLDASGLCALCRLGATEFDWGRGYAAYDGALRRLIHLLKYNGMRPLARPLGARLATLLPEAGRVDLIVPVPLDRRRRRARGFNQAELLAAELRRISGIPMDSTVLRRRRRTETQTGLTHRQRRMNVRGAFEVVRPPLVAGRHIALVDDVITTGATAGACARALKRAGAQRVIVLALARARRRIVDPGPPPPAGPLSRSAACEA